MGVESLLQQGLACFGRRDYAAALTCFDQVLEAQPRQLHALNGRGGALLQLGRGEEALACFTQVLAIEPRHALALNNQGSVLAQLGRHADALACFERAAALAPARAETLCNRGLMLDRLERHEEALRSFDAALALDPLMLPALRWKAQTLQRLGRHAQALECSERALRLAPDHRDALKTRAQALASLERREEALAGFQRALELAPGDAGALVGRGMLLLELHRDAEALNGFERALAAAATPDAMNGRGLALLKFHRDAEALECFERAAALQPKDDPWTWNNRGAALLRLNRLAEAIECFERALAIEPRHPARLSRSFALLALGRLEEGFRDQEQRWHVTGAINPRPPRPASAAPLWLGRESPQGRSILLFHEQGLGDTLQFMRYAPLVAARGARVILGVPPELVRLARSLPGVAEVTDGVPALPPHDLQCPMMSLPLAFGTTLSTIPADIPYLRADPALVERWKERLGPMRGKPRIGLSWAGRQSPPRNYPRDIALELLRPLLQLDAEFVAVQKEIPEGDRALLEASRCARYEEALGDFADTAALLENLDLLITVDTSMAHLAGALGRPVWIMNRYASCWRWFQDRSDSPWYPSARLFRQPAYGDWYSVVAQVAAALAQRFGLSRAKEI